MQRRRILITILAVTVSLSACNGEPKRALSKEAWHAYYKFYNSLVPKDSVKAFFLTSKPSFGNPFHRSLFDNKEWLNDSLLSPADTLYMHQQLDAAKGFAWQQDSLIGATIIPEHTLNEIFASGVDKGWEIFYNRYQGRGFDTFSIPLFSVDGYRCLVYQTNSCGGLCGAGYVNVYVMRSGKWDVSFMPCNGLAK